VNLVPKNQRDMIQGNKELELEKLKMGKTFEPLPL
jgi:hypothetical protein